MYPLRETVFEGVEALVPYSFDRILTEEYSARALVRTSYEGYVASPTVLTPFFFLLLNSNVGVKFGWKQANGWETDTHGSPNAKNGSNRPPSPGLLQTVAKTPAPTYREASKQRRTRRAGCEIY